MTIREIVLASLCPLVDDVCMTATQLANANMLQLASVSSELRKMYDEGIIERVEGHGPRGGYGYKVKKT